MKIAITNLGAIVSGDWRNPLTGGDTIITEGETIASVGTVCATSVESADVVIDAGGMTAIPGRSTPTFTSPSATIRRDSVPSVTSKAICMAA